MMSRKDRRTLWIAIGLIGGALTGIEIALGRDARALAIAAVGVAAIIVAVVKYRRIAPRRHPVQDDE